MKRLAPSLGVIAALAGGACRAAPPAPSPALPLGLSDEIRLPGPGTIAVRAAVAARGHTVAVAWVATSAGVAAVYVATSANDGASFRAPIRLTTLRETNVDAEQPPRVFFDEFSAAAPLAVEWIERSGTLDSARYAHSVDGGATFARDRPEAVRLVHTGASDADPEIPESVIKGAGGPTAAHWRGVVDADGTLVVAWDESRGAQRRVAMQRIVLGGDGAFQPAPLAPVTEWSAAAKPAIASIEGGVILAWVDEQGERSSIRLRRVGLERLCADPKATPPRVTLDWAPWPSPLPPPRHHD